MELVVAAFPPYKYAYKAKHSSHTALHCNQPSSNSFCNIVILSRQSHTRWVEKMGSNVFGTPISKEMLRAMPEYHENNSITAEDCAIVALEMKNAEGKDINARAFLESLETRFGQDVSTMCMIYNATGEPLRLVEFYNWTGHVCESPYPMVILNGQWGVFLHGKIRGGVGASQGVVVYRGKNMDWMLSFSNRQNIPENRVYTEIFSSGPFEAKDWNNINKHLEKGNTTSRAKRAGALMFASIGDISKCAVEAILTTSEALTPKP